MDPDKASFLFPDAPPGIDLDDPDVVAALLETSGELDTDVDDLDPELDDLDPEFEDLDDDLDEDDFDEDDFGALRPTLRRVVLQQVHDDNPPEVWATAQRLLAAGLSRDDVLDQLVLALLPLMIETLDADRDPDAPPPIEQYPALLDRLPLPTPAMLADAVVETVRTRQPISDDELDEAVAERLGALPDDPVLRPLIEGVLDDLLEPGGPLAYLSPDRIVHVTSFVAGVVLTHRLSGSERATGRLEIETDLLPFAGHDSPRLPDGSRLDPTTTPDGLLGWVGPSGWLDGVEAGGLVAVRVDVDGVVSIERADPPGPSEDVVSLVRGAYDDAMGEAFLPVDSDELVLTMVDRERSAFTQPLPPLVELAAAAGLERRGRAFGHDDAVWAAADEVAQAHRLHDRLGPGEPARAALSVLNDLSGDRAGPGELRDVLDEMYQPDVLDAVTDELLGLDDDPDRIAATDAVAGRLIAAATRPRQRAVALYLAAVVAERAGRVRDAEEHVRAAFREDPDWPLAVDRAGWYRSDQGDAAGAAELWRRLGPSEELRLLERVAVPDAPALGRNERCWCGSGRKYKVCHLGRSALPALPERIDWLYGKAVAYLYRRGGRIELDADRFGDGSDGPLLDEILLVEGGWFERFLAERGPLLPEDEAALARSWVPVRRSVHEIVETIGDRLQALDLRTGDRVEVRDRTSAGQRVCGRVVPDGEGHRFVGPVVVVPPGAEQDLFEVLDDGDATAVHARLVEMWSDGERS